MFRKRIGKPRFLHYTGGMPRQNKFADIRPSSMRTAVGTAMFPITKLDTLARLIFNNAVVHAPHLKHSDTTLLTAYAVCASRVLREKVSKSQDVSSMIRLARQLRLTSMATTDPRTAFRRKAGTQPDPLAQYLADNPDGEDDNDDTTA